MKKRSEKRVRGREGEGRKEKRRGERRVRVNIWLLKKQKVKIVSKKKLSALSCPFWEVPEIESGK